MKHYTHNSLTSLTGGIVETTAGFSASTATQQRNFKSLDGAKKWLAREGYVEEK